MIASTPSPPLCPDCGHAVAGSIDGRGWCIWCARECFLQHKRPSPGIATTGDLAACGDEPTSEQHDAA